MESLILGGRELPMASFPAETELPHVGIKERLANMDILGGLSIYRATCCWQGTPGRLPTGETGSSRGDGVSRTPLFLRPAF